MATPRSVRPRWRAPRSANDLESIFASTLYSAGADYDLTLSKGAARMTTYRLFDEGVLTLYEQIQVVWARAPELEGTHPVGDVGEGSDSVVVGVQRGDDVITGVDDASRIKDDDELLVAGADRSASRFETEFGE